MKRKWMIPVVAVLALALVFVGWRTLRRRSTKGDTQYATATVQRGPLEVTVTNTGSLISGLSRDLRATISATADDVLVKVGDRVTAGQLLARLRNQDLVESLNQAQSGLAAEEARLADMQNPPSKATQSQIKTAEVRVSQAESALAERRADLNGLTVTSPIDGVIGTVGITQGDTASASQTLFTVIDSKSLEFVAQVPEGDLNQATLGNKYFIRMASGAGRYGKVTHIGAVAATSQSGTTYSVTMTLEPVTNDDGVRPGMGGIVQFPGVTTPGVVTGRTSTLKARVSATASDIRVAAGDKVAAGQVLAAMTSDTAALNLSQAEADLASAQADLNELLHPEATATAAELAAEQAKVDQCRTTYQSAQRDVNELTVSAPIDGVITAANVKAGDEISGGGTSQSVLFTVADFTKMSVQISVDELDVARLQVGMEATVDVQAKQGQQYKAAIASITPQGTVSQGVATYPVELELVDPQGLLAGMTANVTIICERHDNVLYVPVEAVTKIRDRSVVRVLDATGKETSVEVATGLANDMCIEITSGLTEGQTVITGSASSSSGNGARMGMGVPAGGGKQVYTTTTPGGGR